MKSSNTEKLARLDNTGLHIVSGQLLNLFDEPSGVGRPPKSPSEKGKEVFTREESIAVFTLLNAGQKEGRKGNGLFQLLESMDVHGSHSWQSYENHFRKAKVPATPLPTPPWEASFPALAAFAQGPIEERRDVPSSTARVDEAEKSFSDSRVDIARNVYRELCVADKHELEILVTHSTVFQALAEYKADLLDRELATGGTSKTVSGRSHHHWKTDYALLMINTQSERFAGADIDKTGWSADDHDTRFIVRMCTDATAGDHPWASAAADRHLICERALWLMLWFRWVYKPCTGMGEDSLRQTRIKDWWRTRLSPLYQIPAPHPPPTPHPEPGLAIVPEDGLVVRAQEQTNPAGPSARGRALGPSASTTTGRNAAPNANVRPAPAPALTGTQDTADATLGTEACLANMCVATPSQPRQSHHAKASRWLDGDAWQMFSNQQSKRLAGWGVTPQHRGSCVLVSDLWSNSYPPDLLMIDPSDWPTSDALKQRLTVSLRGYSASWARAAVWFNTWPRSGSDLDEQLLATNMSGTGPKCHASHLCHQGLCINPNHIVLELAEQNIDRIQCMYTAKALRAYGVPVPEHCIVHPKKPCLMHFAALELAEALSIQFFVLREALGISQPDDTQIPESHPKHLSTYESSIPTQLLLTAIALDRSQLVTPTGPNFMIQEAREKHLVTCHFCPDARRVWNSITAYWSHLRTLHADRRLEVMAEIQRSGEAYEQWAHEHFHDLPHHNTSTWAKLVQTRADNFSWEVVQGWRLSQDRLNQGRSKGRC